MGASKTGLDEYKKNGKSVFAVKIISIEDYPHVTGAKTIKFLRPNGNQAEANLLPAWVQEHNPQVGGYWVVDDTENGRTQAKFEADAQKFEREYKKEKR